jgi:beta-1,2-mannobiose phosphorylase / 1,2-beta-oligomannan phosphorylase
MLTALQYGFRDYFTLNFLQISRVGDVNNVVFLTGACVIDGKFHVYYGGAGKVCFLSVVELNAFLEYMLNETINN